MDSQYLSVLEETLRQTFDPASVKQASQKLQKELYDNELAIPSLIQILQTSQDDAIKHLSAIESRKLIKDKWETVNATIKPQIKSSLLTSIFQQQSKLVQHAFAIVISAIAEQDLDNNEWPEALPTLVSSIQGSDDQSKVIATYTLYSILDTQVPSIASHTNDFLSLFGGLLTDKTSRDIRVTSVLALDILSQFVEESLDDDLADKFKTCIPGMVEVLKEVIAADDSEKVKEIFNVFNALVYVDSKLVGDHFVSILQLVTEIATNTQLDEEYRSFALQFLISCVTIRKSKISSNKLGPQITQLAAKIASEEVDIEEELENEDEVNENEENSPPALALRLIAMLSSELPPSQVIVPLFELVPNMLASSNQFERRAGLLAIGISSSGAPDYISTQVHKIIPAIISGLQDSQPIVKVAALRTLTQLTSELQDNVSKYHEELLPLVIEVINNASNVQAYKYGCFALDSLIEFMSHDAMGKYIDPLMQKLVSMIQQPHSSSLKTAIVSAIGSVAFASGKAFTPYFNESVQLLEPYIANAADTEGMSEDDIELRAITFENISTMARAVGSEAFSTFAKPLVEAAYSSISSEHSRIRESGFAFISNMAKVYGAEFSGFMELIVPKILECLEQNEFTFNVDAEDVDNEEDLANAINVHTGITIEKEIASVALGELAVGTGKDFAKYVDVSIKTLSEQIENSYGMREAAINCLFKITKAMFVATQGKDFKAPKGVPKQSYVDPSILQLIQQVRGIAIPLLEEEFDLTMVGHILDGFTETIHAFGPIAIVDNANDTAALELLCMQLLSILKKEHPCQLEDEEGPADEEEASETDALLYESALEVIVNLSLALESDFAEIFATFKEIIFSQVKSKSKSIRVSSVGALAEIVGGLKASNPYSEELLQVFMDRVTNDKSLEVKGNAAYGIGLIVETSNADLSSAYPTILQLLFQLLSKADKKANTDDEETKDVVNRSYANACGCVARMILKNQQAVPLEHVIGPLINHLPLETGLEENAPIFKLILKLYEIDNPNIINETQKIVDIFAKVFTKEAERIRLAEESTLGRDENIEAMKQFASDDLRAKVVELLKYLDNKYSGVVSSNETLKAVIA
jgi:hypothetical protein